jgi:streptogramin lyase
MRRTEVRRGRRWQPGVEGLESRRLLAAVVVQEYPVPNAGGVLNYPGIVTGPDGNLWLIENSFFESRISTAVGGIDVIDPRTGAATLISVPNEVSGITDGSDGNVWISLEAQNELASISPTTHAVTYYSVPGTVGGIVGVPGGDIWYTDSADGTIGTFSLATHTATEYPLALRTSQPTAITIGPGGDLWFVESQARRIGTIDPTTHSITEIPTQSQNNLAATIASVGGKIYFVETTPGVLEVLEVLDPVNHDAISDVTEVSTNQLLAGPDGDLYFVTSTASTAFLNSYNPVTGALVASIIPGGIVFTAPESLAVGPDGDIWIGDFGRVDQAAIVPAGAGAITSTVQGTLQVGSTVAYNNLLAGRIVYLDLRRDGELDPGDPTVVTGPNGSYLFNDLAPGTYTVRLETYPGETLTGAAGAAPTVVVQAGGIASPAPFGVVSAGTVLPLNLPPAPFGTKNPDVSTAEVNGLYNIILGRAPDPAGLAAWVGALKNGMPLASVAAGLFGSVEYQTDLVASYFKNYLDRTGSPGEVAAWVALMQQGLTAEQIAADFHDSAEYSALHATDADFIQSLYFDILGRAGTAPELTSWEAAIAGGLSRAQVVQAFLGSPEAATRDAIGFGVAFFGPASPSSYDAFVAALESGTSQVEVAIEEITSGGFVGRANQTVV